MDFCATCNAVRVVVQTKTKKHFYRVCTAAGRKHGTFPLTQEEEYNGQFKYITYEEMVLRNY